jgi:hypothetical protein
VNEIENTGHYRALLCTLGAQKAQNHSNKPLWFILSCFKPFLPTLGDFSQFRDFLQILDDFLLNRRFFRKGRGVPFFGRKGRGVP